MKADAHLAQLRLFVTPGSSCSYLPGRQARNLVADPQRTDQGLYDQLIGLGFRRSGEHLYRPRCGTCSACQSLRIPAVGFTPRRSQSRCRKKNADLRTTWRPAYYDPRHYELFERYVTTRHAGGGMDDPSPGNYREFLLSSWAQVYLCELYSERYQRLLAVSVVDQLADGLSAVYTFFDPDPDCRARGLGTYAILALLDETARLGLDWLYLGYWIENCDKMRYKAEFRPHQTFTGRQWNWV